MANTEMRERAVAAEKKLVREMGWTPRMLDSLFDACGDLESAVEQMEKSIENGVRGDDPYAHCADAEESEARNESLAS